MNKIATTGGIIFRISIFFCIVIMGILLTGDTIQGQTVTTWRIQNSTIIEGISTEPIGSNIYRTWFTEYNRAKIGKIITQPAMGAFVSEWKPDSAIEFHPFKIVTGRYNYTIKKTPAIIGVLPYSDFLPSDENFKAVPKLIEQSVKLRTFAAFTLPDEGKVGMLHQNVFGGPDYFWLWRTADVGLLQPWDIQRRSQSYKETAMWISNQTPQSALYQFMPLTNSLTTWNLTSCQIDVRVFYVVPGIAGKNTEIWIGGRDTSKNVDYIAYMNIDSKNILKAFYKWPLTGTRTMTSICFTQKLSTRTGFTNAQVWLTSSTIPEVTILQPKSLYVRTESDYLCESSSVDSIEFKYQSANGVFWPSVLFPASADNNRRIWISGGQNTQMNGMLAAVQGDATVKIQKLSGAPVASTIQVVYDVQLALRSDKTIDPDTNTITPEVDTVACSTKRLVWDNTGGFNPDFSSIKLDIDINGRASPDQAAPSGFNYDLIWHEQGSGRIGRMATGAMAAIMPSVTEGSGMDLPDEFSLAQNYPNPFNPATTINYVLPEDAIVTLIVYNSLGQEVRKVLNNEFVEMGEQSVMFNSNGLASGVYFYRLSAKSIAQEADAAGGKMFMDVKKMLLVK